MFDSLRAQIVLLTLGALTLAQAVSLWLFVDERSLAVRAALGAEAAGRAANVARLLDEAPDELRGAILRAADSPLVRFAIDPTPAVDHFDHGDEGGVEARMRDILGQEDAREIRIELHEAHGELIPLASTGEEARSSGLTRLELTLSLALADGRWLNVDTRFNRPPLQWPVVSTLSFGISAALLLVALFWFLLSRLIGPLRDVAAASERFGRGEAEPDLPLKGPRELRDLTARFNDMKTRISRHIEDRTRVLAALGHDLRSPLTAFRVQAEMVEEDDLRMAMTASVEEMQAMVETTLAYARGMSEAEPREALSGRAFLEALRQDMLGGFEIVEGADVRLWLRPRAMRRALRNVIENAQRYGGGPPEVSLRTTGAEVSIVVADRGAGIPDADLERVFEPFFRLERSRSRDTGGTGLGLSIARTILRAHGGDIYLENRPEGGLCAVLVLPEAAEG
ncbi:ATP-binding protein [Roseovarius sp. C7]|uniref:ATP-binding protein n=1 Tax=Roseovarius sp. C7 TaxID=3398643 RepID=UPI0039F66738